MTYSSLTRSGDLHLMLRRYFLLSLLASFASGMLVSTNGQSPSTRSSLGLLTVDDSYDELDSSLAILNDFTLLNTSSTNRDDDCFDASAEPRLIPAQLNDCLYAVVQIKEKGAFNRPITFTRMKAHSQFGLPLVFRSGTCVISVDVVHDADEDRFLLGVIHKAALDLSVICVGRSPHVGGKLFVGPKKLVYVMIFGRTLPSAPTDRVLVHAATNNTRNLTLELA